jgi:prenyltransferase/squalene oxidase-like repeat protein
MDQGKVDILNESLVGKAGAAVDPFCGWLDRYGQLSYDYQSVFASKLGGRAKALYYRTPVLGTLAVAPMVFCDACVPSARRLFWKPQRFPIADAHYAMGFAFLAEVRQEEKYYQTAVHFLEVLKQTRCRDYDDYCWGYPFNWETRTGTITEGTPLITTVPYVYEAFSQVYALDNDPKWLAIMQSIAEHAFTSYRNLETASDSASCAYTPAQDDPCGVINASAYRAFLLAKAGTELGEPQYLKMAEKNLNFVLASQNPDGSWYYSIDGQRDFIDHFHTCFVLKALAKIDEITARDRCRSAIERGVRYYIANLFDPEGLPVPFSRRPRLTIYRRELYDYAECINLAVLLSDRFPELERILSRVVTDLLERWQKPDGAFRTRQLLVGWDNVPMHRWAQSQVFRSLCLLLSRGVKEPQNSTTHASVPALELKATT